MRRLARLLAIVLVLGVAPASAHPMAPSAGVDQFALSLWIEEGSASTTLYVAMGGRRADTHSTPGDMRVPAFGLVGRGPCRATKRGAMCRVRGKVRPLVTEFEMDPTMESAHLTLATERFTHVVDWTGEESASHDVEQDGSVVYAYMNRPASVTAELYGRSFEGGDLISVMQTAVYGAADAPFVEFHDDGTFSARVTLGRNGYLSAP
jgi:hypothetical protein